jgi:hypothetical protein
MFDFRDVRQSQNGGGSLDAQNNRGRTKRAGTLKTSQQTVLRRRISSRLEVGTGAAMIKAIKKDLDVLKRWLAT